MSRASGGGQSTECHGANPPNVTGQVGRNRAVLRAKGGKPTECHGAPLEQTHRMSRAKLGQSTECHGANPPNVTGELPGAEVPGPSRKPARRGRRREAEGRTCRAIFRRRSSPLCTRDQTALMVRGPDSSRGDQHETARPQKEVVWLLKAAEDEPDLQPIRAQDDLGPQPRAPAGHRPPGPRGARSPQRGAPR
jgi:hypothetical protein